MKTAKRQKVKTVDAPTKLNASTDYTGIKKSTKRTGGQCPKATGQSEQLVVEKDENSIPSSMPQSLCPQLPKEGIYFPETTKRSPVLELDPGQTVHPSAKIKLQLFPLDESTRTGLEKDGHHPYLELILRARKKISSVIKHLNSKWGGSGIALGEPMLFPYDAQLKNVIWTLNDSGISAGDVYAALGSPAIFRLRYGWLSNCGPKKFGVLSTYTPFESCLQSEGIQKGCSSNMGNIYGKGEHILAKIKVFQPINMTGAANAMESEKKYSDKPVGRVYDEVRMDNGLQQSPVLWDDSLTNISIGGLLSEASLQGRFNNSDSKSNGILGLQPNQLISDSFDAFIAAQVNHPQVPRPISNDSRSSILDAEETCHAFSFQKLSSSGKDVLALGGSAYSRSCHPDAVSKSCRYPNLDEINGQAHLPQDHACQESNTDLLLCSQVYNDESSLGLRGIKWTDSLGPFDLGLASS
ncbi:hypothetical protein L1049_002604 [Liquidambar formosana]|uniref:TSL-kinase interacting protein 1 n=1 Tax=Liquidambar formosana TaxID=63359 RepID=A0AAP0R902_LIQFO